MIVYKIYKYEGFEKVHKGYFDTLLEAIRQQNCLSTSIEEIIITDDIDSEIERYCVNRSTQPNLTRSKEFKAIAKTIDFEGSKKVFFDATRVNVFVKYAHQIFFEQLIEVYAEDIIAYKYNVPQTFYSDTPLTEIINIFFSQWATKVTAKTTASILEYEKDRIHFDVKMYVDAYKRNVRKLHYQYQADSDLATFWIEVVTELDYFIRRCLDVRFDEGAFTSLQEFEESIPPLLSEIVIQTQHILCDEEMDTSSMKSSILKILKASSIEIPSENPMVVRIVESPKKIFRGSLIDTEPRIVAFIDILGFSAIIEDYDSDTTSNILNELHDTLDMAVRISIDNMNDSKAQTDLKEFLEYRMFSDCICISLPYIEYENDFHIQFQSLAMVVKSYQLAMMQRGFFVMGGISIGSFFADKHMIFSGGLVNAYKLEQTTGHPIIAIDRKVIDRLHKNFAENSKNLFYDNILIYSQDEPEKIFLNPFDILDNSKKYLDYLQSAFDNLKMEDDGDNTDQFSGVTNSLLEVTSSLLKPVFDSVRSQMIPENMNMAKEEILKYINEQISKQTFLLSNITSDNSEAKGIRKVISKYEYLKSIINWSMGRIDEKLFKFYDFLQSDK